MKEEEEREGGRGEREVFIPVDRATSVGTGRGLNPENKTILSNKTIVRSSQVPAAVAQLPGSFLCARGGHRGLWCAAGWKGTRWPGEFGIVPGGAVYGLGASRRAAIISERGVREGQGGSGITVYGRDCRECNIRGELRGATRDDIRFWRLSIGELGRVAFTRLESRLKGRAWRVMGPTGGRDVPPSGCGECWKVAEGRAGRANRVRLHDGQRP